MAKKPPKKVDAVPGLEHADDRHRVRCVLGDFEQTAKHLDEAKKFAKEHPQVNGDEHVCHIYNHQGVQIQ